MHSNKYKKNIIVLWRCFFTNSNCFDNSIRAAYKFSLKCLSLSQDFHSIFFKFYEISAEHSSQVTPMLPTWDIQWYIGASLSLGFWTCYLLGNYFWRVVVPRFVCTLESPGEVASKNTDASVPPLESVN